MIKHSTVTSGGEHPVQAFTFVEVLASMLFMAIIVPVAIHGMTIANRAGVVAERKNRAAALADNLLTELVLTEDWTNSEDDGDFGDDWPGYRWELELSEWDENESVMQLAVRVYFSVQGIEYNVPITTLVKLPGYAPSQFSGSGTEG